jgi:sugar-phosphatase
MAELSCRALLLDLGGVLVDSRAVVERTWRRWAALHGLDADALLRVAHGRRTRDTLREVAPHVDLDREVAWLDAAEERDLEGLVPVRGARRLVAALVPAQWAVVTSGHARLARLRLGAAGLPTPGVLVTGETVARGKPAPDGYLRAAAALGLGAAACVAIEDTPAGIAAGRAAGTRVVAVTTTHEAPDLAGADAVVEDLEALVVRVAEGELRVLWRDPAA